MTIYANSPAAIANVAGVLANLAAAIANIVSVISINAALMEINVAVLERVVAVLFITDVTLTNVAGEFHDNRLGKRDEVREIASSMQRPRSTKT